jgi:hypothetical protein
MAPVTGCTDTISARDSMTPITGHTDTISARDSMTPITGRTDTISARDSMTDYMTILETKADGRIPTPPEMVYKPLSSLPVYSLPPSRVIFTSDKNPGPHHF